MVDAVDVDNDGFDRWVALDEHAWNGLAVRSLLREGEPEARGIPLIARGMASENMPYSCTTIVPEAEWIDNVIDDVVDVEDDRQIRGLVMTISLKQFAQLPCCLRRSTVEPLPNKVGKRSEGFYEYDAEATMVICHYSPGCKATALV